MNVITRGIRDLQEKAETIPMFRIGICSGIAADGLTVSVVEQAVDADGVSQQITLTGLQYIGPTPSIFDTVQMVDLGRGQRMVLGIKNPFTVTPQLALGIIPGGLVTTNANSPAFTSTIADWPALTLPVTLQPSRIYELRAYVPTILGAGMNNVSEANILLREGGFPLSLTRGSVNQAGMNAQGMEVATNLVSPTAGSHTYKVSGRCDNTGTFQGFADTDSEAWIRIMDIGPA